MIPILRFSVMHGYVCFIAPIDHCVKIKSCVRDFLWKLLSFHTEMILAIFLCGSVLLKGKLRKYAKNSDFDNFESALNSTSGSLPLNTNTFHLVKNIFLNEAKSKSCIYGIQIQQPNSVWELGSVMSDKTKTQLMITHFLISISIMSLTGCYGHFIVNTISLLHTITRHQLL